jgi:hypothetical protein
MDVHPFSESNGNRHRWMVDRRWGWLRPVLIIRLTAAGASNPSTSPSSINSITDTLRDPLAIRERLAQSDPGNAGWQFDVGISNERIGNVQVAQDDLAAAAKSYKAKRDIISRLAQSDPGNAGWQRDLAVSYSKIAGLLRQQGDNAQALDSLKQGRAIIARLTLLSPTNATWKSDLAWFDRQIAALAR